VIEVKVRQEDLVHPRHGHLERVVVGDATGTRVKHETIAVSKLDEDADAHLCGPNDVAPAGAHQGDAHLVGCQLLARVIPQVRARDDILQLGGSRVRRLCARGAHRHRATGNRGTCCGS